MRRSPANGNEGIRMTEPDNAPEKSKDWLRSFALEYGKASAYALGTATIFFIIWAVVMLLLIKCS